MIKQLPFIIFQIFAAPLLFGQEHGSGGVWDIDSNYYHTITAAKYEWMAENLRTKTYNHGQPITYVSDSLSWAECKDPAYCFYNNDIGKTGFFGYLYNWYAVNTGRLCPDGWRVTSDDEWKHLEGFVDSIYSMGDPIWDKSGLRGSDVAAKLKSSFGWDAEGIGDDYFGFAALPGGERLTKNGRYCLMGRNGFWWTSTEGDESSAWFRSMVYSFDELSRDTHDKKFGFSVRCIRDKKDKKEN